MYTITYFLVALGVFMRMTSDSMAWRVTASLLWPAFLGAYMATKWEETE